MSEGKTGVPLQNDNQQQAAYERTMTEQYVPLTPESFSGPNDPSPTQQHFGQPQALSEPGQWTAESASRPETITAREHTASVPWPQALRSGHGPSEPPETPFSRLTVSPIYGTLWKGQGMQTEEAWSSPAGAARPMPTPVRTNSATFHWPGTQQLPPGAMRPGSSIQNQQYPIKLEDQEQALRDHVASLEQRFGSDKFNSPTPGVWWQPSHLATHQAQRANFAHDNGQASRQPRPAPPAAHLSAASTISGYPGLKNITLEGYELLATKLTDATIGVRPMYRGFEQLSHRVLLYLQDEICEFEEELRNLDEWIAQVGGATSDGKPKPASRRAEARLTPAESELQFRRKFVLGETYVKMERYCEFLVQDRRSV